MRHATTYCVAGIIISLVLNTLTIRAQENYPRLLDKVDAGQVAKAIQRMTPSGTVEYDPLVDAIINQTNQDSLISYVRILSGEDSVMLGDSMVLIQDRGSAAGGNLAADYLKQKLASYSLEVHDQAYSGSGRNVYAVQYGLLYPEKQFILCAHYDAVSAYCADDNASGVAAVIEAARILSQYHFNYTLIYALWDEEESGLVGSGYYATDASANGDQIQGVLDLDMLGWDGNDDNLADVHMQNTGHSNILANMLVTVDFIYDLPLDLVIYNPGTWQSDHSSFWNRGYGAVLLIEAYYGGDLNPYYHGVEDRIARFNLPYFHNLSKLAIGSIATLVEATEGTLIVPRFSAAPLEGKAPLTVQFTDQSVAVETQIAKWSWDFEGDGIIDDSSQNPTHIYNYGGLYSVTLTIVDTSGLTESIRKTNCVRVEWLTISPDSLAFNVRRISVATQQLTSSNVSPDTLTIRMRGGVLNFDTTQYEMKGTLNGHHYLLSKDAVTWHEAKTKCEEAGGHLVTISSESEHNFVKVFNPWIGFTDELVEGQWKWVTGEPVDYTAWCGGQPDNSGDEDYAGYTGNECWNDIWNGNLQKYLLEIESFESSWLAVDTTEIILSPGQSVVKDVTVNTAGLVFGHHEGFVTIAGETPERFERRVMVRLTVPGPVLSVTPESLNIIMARNDTSVQQISVTNTGVDTLMASVKLTKAAGMNLLDPMRYEFKGVLNGHGYYLSKHIATWHQAKSESERAGGHLATVATAEEDSFLQSIVNETLFNAWVWIGFTDELGEGNWKWVTGERTSYTHWYPGQPDNGGCCSPVEHYAHYWPDCCGSEGGGWNDWHGSAATFYFLEVDNYDSLMSAITCWLSIDTTQIILPPSQSVLRDVRLISAELPGGTYNGEITVSSNDPDRKIFKLTVAMTVPHDPADSVIYVQVLASGWNLLSLPVHPSSHGMEENYSMALSRLFEYHEGYCSCDSLGVCKGYWLKIGNTTAVRLWGYLMSEELVTVSAGWNIVGSLSTSIPATSIASDPPGIFTSQFFEYDGTVYVASDSIRPGKGYWVKVERGGKLFLSATAIAATNRINIVATSERPPAPPADEQAVLAVGLPEEYQLNQNYPNPFNPVTTIGYGLPISEHVILIVYNMVGQEVGVLVNERQQAGRKTVSFDATNLPSGVYTYRITAGTFTEVKKMVLIK